VSALSILHGPALSHIPHETLAQMLLGAAGNFPSHGITFIDSNGKEDFLSYPSLLASARRYLSGLIALGLQPGNKVIVSIDDSKEFIVVFWACVLGGIVPAPISEPASATDPSFQRITGVWQALGHPRIIVDERRLERWEALRQNPLLADAHLCPAAALAASAQADIYPSKCDDLALLQYSSGSTGQPKGVMLSHANLMANCFAISTGTAMTSGDVGFNWLPLTHDMGLIGQHLVAIFVGVQIVQLSPATFLRAPLLCLRKIGEHRASLFSCPNFGIDWLNRQIANDDLQSLNLSSLRVIFNGAEPISIAIMNRFMEKFAAAKFSATAMFPVYGLAEATLAVSFPALGSLPHVIQISRSRMVNDRRAVPATASAEDSVIHLVSEGGPVAGVTIRIVDEYGNTVAEDVIGEIQLKGASITAGYYKNNEANGRSFQDGWFKTGDAGFISDRKLFVSGRLKEIIFVHGRNYYSHDIEEVLYSIDGFSRGGIAVVGSFNHATQSEELIVFAKHKGDISRFLPARGKVIECIRGRLEIEVTHVIPVSSIPKTTSGKVQRFVLRSRYENGEFQTAIETIGKLVASRMSEAPVVSEPETEFQHQLRRIWSRVLNIDERAIGIDSDFRSLGGNSINAMQLLGELERLTGSQMAHEVLLKCRTIRELDPIVSSTLRRNGQTGQTVEPSAPRLAEKVSDPERDIAITGLAVRLPFADTADQFWDKLCDAANCIAPVSAKRKALSRCHDWNDFMGELKDIEWFDNKFFEIPDEEARFMDPQQRILLEMSYGCLEDAGLANRLDEESDIGVYVGISSNGYAELLIKRLERDGLDGITQGTMAGNLINIIAARVSHKFNFTGPAMCIDTACSSFMVAIREAVRALRAREVSGALVGSTNLLITPTTHRLAQKAGILSPSNRCRVFDREADGSTLGEGAVLVFLEPLAEAIKNRKHIYGVIKGVAVNNDGCSLGVMAPNPRGQLAVLRDAYRDAGISPAEVSYIEAHGTGTALGDPVEMRALSNLFKEAGARDDCGIGSVKSNVGHLLHAAGGVGLAKVLLCLEHQLQVPTVGVESLNPSLEIEKSPFCVVTKVKEWQSQSGHPRKAGVSSFGFGGTNAHLVLEQYVDGASSNCSGTTEPATHLLTFSSRSESSLRRLIDSTMSWIEHHPNVFAAHICFTRNRFRKQWPHRAAFVFNDLAHLTAYSTQQPGRIVEVTGYFDRKRPAKTVCLVGDAGDFEEPSLVRSQYAGSATAGAVAGACVAESVVSALQSGGVSIDATVSAESWQDAIVELDKIRPEIVLAAGLSEAEAARLRDYCARDRRTRIVEVDHRPLLSVVAEVWVHGGRVAWERVHPEDDCKLVSLPGYSFDRSPFWLE
jgi:acyl-CoA synthetase (AMP-forming)/AMP-acid ligase II/3-oxoacyl-(acyl-carrier-protein) synthase/acyl carrier protein